MLPTWRTCHQAVTAKNMTGTEADGTIVTVPLKMYRKLSHETPADTPYSVLLAYITWKSRPAKKRFIHRHQVLCNFIHQWNAGQLSSWQAFGAVK